MSTIRREKKLLMLFCGLLFLLTIVLSLVTNKANAQEGPKVMWKMQSVFPPPEEVYSGAGVLGVYGQFKELARRVEKRTGGMLQIKIYLPGELCKLQEAPEALMTGMIDVLGGNAMYWTGVWPEGFIAGNIPYGTKSYEEFRKIYTDTDYIKILRRGHAKKNVYWLCNIESASANFMTNFPLHSLADIKGKKIAASGPRAKMIQDMGGSPVNVAGAEMYTALQRGMVDGITYPPYTGVSYKFFEVLKYVVWPGITVPSMGEVLINLKSWEKLPAHYQKILNEEAFNMFVNEALPKWGPQKDKLAEQKAGDYRVKNIYQTDEEYEKMRVCSIPHWKEWAKLSPENADLIAIFLDRLKAK